MKTILLLILAWSCSWVPDTKGPIRKVTKTRQTDYMDCLRKSKTYQLNRENQKSWRVIAQYTIQENGKISDASITNSDFEESSLHQCILNELAGLSFPTPEKGPKVVRQMFDLNPGEEK